MLQRYRRFESSDIFLLVILLHSLFLTFYFQDELNACNTSLSMLAISLIWIKHEHIGFYTLLLAYLKDSNAAEHSVDSDIHLSERCKT